MAVGRRAMEYRSEQVWGDLPVVHVSVGGRQADGRYRLGRARGIIALGDVATGLVAVGSVAIGLFSVGGVAVGLVALGGVAIALVAIALVAVGGVAVGLVAIGAVAMGLTAVGAVTAGLVGPGPRPPVGSVTRPELLAEESRRSGVRDACPQAPMASGP
jgi:GLTT repeat (6 copies)